MRVHSVEELVDSCCCSPAIEGKVASGPGVGVITFGGGNGVLGADQCAQHGLATPALESRSAPSACGRSSFRWRPPPTRSISRRPRRFAPKPWRSFRRRSTSSPRNPKSSRCCSSSARWPRRQREISEVICGLAERAAKPVCVELALAAARRAGAAGRARRLLVPRSGAGHPRARQAGRAWRCGTPTRRRGIASETTAFDWQAFVAVERHARGHSGAACHRILAAAGLACRRRRAGRGRGGSAVRVADAIGLPVVLKGISRGSRIGPRRVSLRSICAPRTTCAPHSVGLTRARPSSSARTRRRLCAEDASAAAPSCSSPRFAIRCSA